MNENKCGNHEQHKKEKDRKIGNEITKLSFD